MPHEQLNEQQVAAYLRMDLREVVKLASRGQIPCRKIAGHFVFHKGELDHWVAAQLHTLGRGRLADIEEGVSEHHGYDPDTMLICPMIPDTGLAVPLLAKTQDAVLRALIRLGERADLVYAPDDLLAAIRKREQLCSTAMIPGVAIPHPRRPLPYDIAKSFVVAGLTASGVPYGAEDGSLTRLFILTCAKDERTHLHVLARLGQMLHERQAVDTLLSAQTPEELHRLLRELEKSVLARK